MPWPVACKPSPGLIKKVTCRWRSRCSAGRRGSASGPAARLGVGVPGGRPASCPWGSPREAVGSSPVSSASPGPSRSLASASTASAHTFFGIAPIAARTRSVMARPTENSQLTAVACWWRTWARNAFVQPAVSADQRLVGHGGAGRGSGPGLVEHGDVVGGGVRPGVAATQHPCQELAGVVAEREQRVVAEGPLERRRRLLLLRVVDHDRRVQVDDQHVELMSGDPRRRERPAVVFRVLVPDHLPRPRSSRCRAAATAASAVSSRRSSSRQHVESDATAPNSSACSPSTAISEIVVAPSATATARSTSTPAQVMPCPRGPATRPEPGTARRSQCCGRRRRPTDGTRCVTPPRLPSAVTMISVRGL
jgi:hypothetical protein